MKNEIILWISSIILVFLIGYIKSITSDDYPITGTFGIEGKKVSYKLDKVCFDKIAYKNFIISDIKGIEAKILWMINNELNKTDYAEMERGLVCEIPKLKAGQSILYKILIHYQDKTYEIPQKEFVRLTFWGNIPPAVNIMLFIFLYGGLLLSIRSVLELFAKSRNLKKYAVITCILFITLVTIVNPLYISYKLEAINHFVPPLDKLLNPLLIFILALWIMGTILIFNKFFLRITTITISAATFTIFFFI